MSWWEGQGLAKRGVRNLLRGLAVLLALLMAWAAASQLRGPATPTAQELRAAADRGAGYIIRETSEQGRFTYTKMLDGSRGRDRNRYNMLRHAGTLYALANWQAQRGTPAGEQALRRGGEFLLAQVDSAVIGDSALALWSSRRVTGYREVAKLGGAGLALVALASAEAALPGYAPLDTMRALGRFVLALQANDGSFVSRYNRGGVLDTSWHSLYYPGEAALGLTLLYELDADPRWLRGALAALGQLAHRRAGRRFVEVDHWALIATGRALPHLEKLDNPPVDAQTLRMHAAQIVRTILWQWRGIKMVPGSLAGSLNLDARTTPTATKLEGLAAALPLLEQTRFAEPMRQALREGAGFLIESQVQRGENSGAMPMGARRWSVYFPAERREEFNRFLPEVRIDYVQHALSAWLAIEQLGLAQP